MSGPSALGASPKRARPFTKLALAALGLVLGAAGAELVTRIWLRIQGTPYSRQGTADELHRLSDPMGAFVPDGVGVTGPKDTAGRLLHPFYASERRADSGGVLAKFREGALDDSYVIVVVGGSVAASFARSVGEDLARRVAEAGLSDGREVRVLNFAHAAYKQPQQATRLTFLFALGYRPDVVINLDGFNEVCAGLANSKAGTHPVYPSAPVWGGVVASMNPFEGEERELLMDLWRLRDAARSTTSLVTERPLLASSVIGLAARRRLHGIATEAASIQRELVQRRARAERTPAEMRVIHGPPFDSAVDQVVDLCVTSWASSSRAIHAICDDRDVVYLHVLQPALNYGDKPRSASEADLRPGSFGWRLGPKVGYDKLRAAGADLAARGIDFLDATGVFLETSDSCFVDMCHLTQRGNELLEELVGEALVERLATRSR